MVVRPLVVMARTIPSRLRSSPKIGSFLVITVSLEEINLGGLAGDDRVSNNIDRW